jgi:hypothetical protein
MPTISNPGTIEAIADYYCNNGRDKAEALVSVGYSPLYASKKGKQLFLRDDLVAAINRYQAKKEANTAYTVERAEAEYEEARQLSIKLNQPSAAVSATTGKARLYGMDKDNQTNEAAPDPITETELAAIRQAAKAATSIKLA